MGSGLEDCRWVDVMIDEIGLVLSKADETIQKSIEFWKELTHDVILPPSKQDSTRQLSSEAKVKEETIQHWAMCASKVPESLNLAQGDYDCYDIDCHCDEKEEEDDATDSEDMCELDLGASATNFSSSGCYQNDNEDDTTGLEWRGGYYKLLKDSETSSDESSQNEEVDEECHSESVKEVMDMLRMKSMCDVSAESLVCHDDEDEDEDEEDIIITNDMQHSDSDWVYVTNEFDL